MKKTGFTLIELMVSIAIIGIISVIVVINIGNTRAKSRDATRMRHMQEISRALGLYISANSVYPNPYNNEQITGLDAVSTALETAGTIPAVQADPLNSGQYVYTYTSAGGLDYTINFCLETDTIQGYFQGCGNSIKP